MSEQSHIDGDKLARYICNESDAAERNAVEYWAGEASANAAELAAFRSAWERAGDATEPNVDVDAAWNKVSGRIGGAQAQVISLDRSRTPLRWLAAAAVIAGVCFAGVHWLMNDRHVELVATNEYQQSTLPDNSVVTLSPNSTSSIKLGEERRVSLEGEAFFEVARDEERPFVVSAQEVLVTVLGTAFEVSAYDTSNIVLVRVKHGRVRVAAAGDSLDLEAGDQARFNRRTKMFERSMTRAIEKWGDRIIQFQAAPMRDVVQELQRMFAVDIKLANAGQEQCMLTATFENEPIHDILEVIAATYGFELTYGGEGIFILKGDGC